MDLPYADHYVQVHRDWCTMTPVFHNGYFGYEPTECMPISPYGTFMGASNDAASIPGPNPYFSCTQAQFDAKAIEFATTYPVLPWELGASLMCDAALGSSVVIIANLNDSFHIFGNYGVFHDDPCKSTQPDLSGQGFLWGAIHTHPVFTSVQEFMEGKGCHDYKAKNPGVTPTMQYVQIQVDGGQQWSNDDRAIWICRDGNTPGYLRASNGLVRKLLDSNCVFIEDRVIP